jgi:hypothetical protein
VADDTFSLELGDYKERMAKKKKGRLEADE